MTTTGKLAYASDEQALERSTQEHNFVSKRNPLPVAFYPGSGLLDAFGRIRMSQPETLFDSKQIHGSQGLFWDDQEVSGSGTGSSWSQLTASSVMSVSATTAGKRVRQSLRRFNYQPGKSQLILMTGVINKTGSGAGLKRAVGLFDDNNGIFFLNDEGNYKLVIRSNTSGTPTDTEVARANWNLDPLDGEGLSGHTLDITKSQIFFIDYEWLGVGTVRCGFVINGALVYCHQFNHANLISGVYMSTPNLPIRFELENLGSGVAASMEHICCTVIAEGGYQGVGALYHIDSLQLPNLASGVRYAVIGLRLQGSHLDADIELSRLSMVCSTPNDICHWEVLLNPQVLGTFNYTDHFATDSTVQVAGGSNTNIIGSIGTIMDGSYFNTDQPSTEIAGNAVKLGSKIDGTPDEIVLCALPVTNNITVQGSLTWRQAG